MTLDHSVLFRRSTTATGLIMAVFVFLVDQITKFMIVHYLGLEQHGSIELLPFLSFTGNRFKPQASAAARASEGLWPTTAHPGPS